MLDHFIYSLNATLPVFFDHRAGMGVAARKAAEGGLCPYGKIGLPIL